MSGLHCLWCLLQRYTVQIPAVAKPASAHSFHSYVYCGLHLLCIIHQPTLCWYPHINELRYWAAHEFLTPYVHSGTTVVHQLCCLSLVRKGAKKHFAFWKCLQLWNVLKKRKEKKKWPSGYSWKMFAKSSHPSLLCIPIIAWICWVCCRCAVLVAEQRRAALACLCHHCSMVQTWWKVHWQKDQKAVVRQLSARKSHLHVLLC